MRKLVEKYCCKLVQLIATLSLMTNTAHLIIASLVYRV